MPCRDWGELEQQENINTLEELLCSCCRTLQDYEFDFDKNPELSKWWHKHKEKDEKRKLKEQAELAERKFISDKVKKILAKNPDDVSYSEMTFLYENKFISHKTYTEYLTHNPNG